MIACSKVFFQTRFFPEYDKQIEGREDRQAVAPQINRLRKNGFPDKGEHNPHIHGIAREFVKPWNDKPLGWIGGRESAAAMDCKICDAMECYRYSRQEHEHAHTVLDMERTGKGILKIFSG